MQGWVTIPRGKAISMNIAQFPLYADFENAIARIRKGLIDVGVVPYYEAQRTFIYVGDRFSASVGEILRLVSGFRSNTLAQAHPGEMLVVRCEVLTDAACVMKLLQGLK